MSYRNKFEKIRSSILLLGLVAVMLTGCGVVMDADKEAGKKKETVDKVLVESATDKPQLAEAVIGDIKNSEYYDGEVNPYMQVLQFPENGSFLEFRVSLGDTVSKGQTIAVTQPAYEEEIEKLEEIISSLQTEYDNNVTKYDLQMKTNEWQAGQMREMVENMDPDMEGFDDVCISFELLLAEGEKLEVEQRQYIEKTEKEIAFQEAKLTRLRGKNEANKIVAKADGVITYLADLKVGDEVGVNSYPVVLADVSIPLVQCDYVTEAEINEMVQIYAIKDGESFELVYHPYEDGELERKKAKGEGVYSFFELKEEKDVLSFGEDVKVVMVKEARENVLMIPANCIRRDGESCFVYRYNGGKRETTAVEIGISDGLYTEILSGIQEGDKIYVSN